MSKSKSRLLGGYNFTDKDPIIDVVRTIVQIDASLRNISMQKNMRRIERDRGPTYNTLQGWFFGDIKSPYFKNVASVVNLCDRPDSLATTAAGRAAVKRRKR